MFNHMIKPALAAGIALVALATPAAAQVNGIGVVEPPVAIAGTQALQTGFQQIGTTYQAQRTSLEQRQTQRQTLVQTLDTNGDGQIDDAEAAVTNDATNPTVQQIQALDAQIAEIQAPIQLAQLYVVSQVAQQYSASVQQVIADQSVQILLSPEAVVYAPQEADLTEEIVAVLNTRIPTVSITPPADWQPNQAVVTLYQQIQQVLVMARMQQQQAAQAAAAGQAPVEGR
ncbi:hypothetical protein GCM10009127_23230 [Alteraurantiacibacter aestuarii]|uniref:OmpH family outer membrane protein n=1 Tax=Alteraurantiacibacter aestuarii TaxID=650004 RepID=UPI0031E0352D